MRLHTRHAYRYLTVLLGGAVLVGALVYSITQGGSPQSREVQAAIAGGDYLVRHFTYEQGVYDYLYDPTEDRVLPGYNLLRHAGTTYALLELYRVEGGAKFLKTAERALDWLLAQKDSCPPPHETYACLYENNEAKLGGSGLAILALVESYRATGNQERLTQAEELAGWLLAIESDAGEFTVHIQARDGALDDHVSLYYPGEAIFGLVRLGEETGNEAYLDAARRAAVWLITVRDKGVTEGELEHDHWLLYGLNELDRLAPDPLFVDHTAKLVRAIEAAQHRSDVPAEWVGGFYDPPRGTPTATRVEGLTAAYALFTRRGDTDMALRAQNAIELGTAFVLRMHLTPERAAAYPVARRALGGFTGSFEEAQVRIDYVQHSISALLGAERVLSP